MNTKRRLSPIIIVLVLAMMLTVVPMFTFASAAEEGGYTVKFAVPDGLDAPDALTGTSITLPDLPTLDGYTSVGWTEEKLPEEAEEAPVYYEPGDTFTPKADTKLYALYSRVAGGGTGFKLYSGTITEGNYLIVYGGGAAKASISSKRLAYDSVTDSNGIIASANADLIWTFSDLGNGNWSLYNASAKIYMAGTGT